MSFPGDRRDPQRQRPLIDGQRATDPKLLSTRECADKLGVSTGFVVGEIRQGRLAALVIERAGKRAMYRISEAALDRYIRVNGWNPASAPSAPNA